MKKLLFCLAIVFPPFAHAHEHVDVSNVGGRLRLSGPVLQTSLYVPRGEPFSVYAEGFPGGWHASELTFTTEMVDENPTVELVSVQGPAGGNFAFWEVGAIEPNWSRATGWNSGNGNAPGFRVAVDGDGHVHGRLFTMDKPGNYTVSFRAVDSNGNFSASTNLTIDFRAQQPPQLSIGISGGNVALSFTSRGGLNYDLQRCEDLAGGDWTTIQTIHGNGMLHTPTDPVSGRPRSFYRLVEY